MRSQLLKTYNNMFAVIKKNKTVFNSIEKIEFKSSDSNKTILREINNLIAAVHYPEYFYLSKNRFKSFGSSK